MKAVIFAGGVGSRLWPLSRKNTPKQFEKIIGDKSTLQLAAERLFPLCNWEDIYISTGQKYFEIIKEQFPKLPVKNIILEPEMRDVGPAIGLISAVLEKLDPDEPVVWLWSDQIMKKEDVFREAVKAGEEIVRQDKEKMVFICQKPRFASQNLGYAEFGEEVQKINGLSVHTFKGFQYRPPMEVVNKFFTDGHHAWNLGYFITTPKFLWSLFKKFAPDLQQKILVIQNAIDTPNFEKVLKEVYPTLDKISFDNAILEKMDKSDAYVLSVDLGWSDIGAWEALKEALTDSKDENALKGRVKVLDTKDSLLFNYEQKLVVGIDLEEILVINTNDVLLVCKKDSVPKIKKFVESLKDTEDESLT